jgi:hypothetical protein
MPAPDAVLAGIVLVESDLAVDGVDALLDSSPDPATGSAPWPMPSVGRSRCSGPKIAST